MTDIIIYPYNILENGTVAVTGDPDTGFPESRLYDRYISLLWKDTVTEAKTFHLDQGADDNLSVGALFIEQHNFSSEDMTLEYSANDADWSNAVSGWTQDDHDLIIKTFTELTKRYWRVTLTSMTNPYCGEIYLSKGYSFEISAVNLPSAEDVVNLQWNKTIGGIERVTEFGDTRKKRFYSFILDPTALNSFRIAMSYLSNYKNAFYIKDHEGDYWNCRLLNQPREQYDKRNHLTTVNFHVIEML